jgi:putative ABC transport system permease protein
MQRKYREATRLKTRAALVDVQTMYESASMIVKLEYALNLITLVAVLILFFIIQVGVVNTLRMTIKERTREIGTMRAIGMPRRDVHTLFMLETLFLSVAACAVGVALAFAGMAMLGRLTFDLEDNPLGMLLVNGHPHFLPTLGGTALYVALILAIAAVTAWFPARRAAKLSPSEALRHFG